MKDDPFAGGVEARLRRVDRELRAAVVDAQCRDWVAERPDRVVFARLDEVRREVRAAADRYRAGPRLTAAAVAGAMSAVLRRSRERGGFPMTAADDPYFYAGLRRRIEACAAAARADPNYRRRPAATDLDHALDWLAAAQAGLPRRF